MKWDELIRGRRSVRTFNGAPLKEEDAQRILEFARSAENPYGLAIEWRLLKTAETGLSTPVIVGEDTYIAGKMRRAPHAEEAFGYSFERAVLYAALLGVGTTWIAGTMDRSAFEKAVGLTEEEFMPCVSPLGYPADKMSLRESLMRKGVKADIRSDFGSLFFEGDFGRPLTPEAAGRLREALEAVRLGPSAVNKQPWRAVVCGNKVHFYEKRGKARAAAEWDVKRVDMGIALCHFALVAEECGLSVRFLPEDPGLRTEADTVYVASYEIA